MKPGEDERLGRLLQTLAPSARDPMFRIRVLERQAQRQYVRRVALLVGTGAGAAVIYATTAALGETNEAMRVAGLVLAAGLAAAMYVPALLKAMRAMAR